MVVTEHTAITCEGNKTSGILVGGPQLRLSPNGPEDEAIDETEVEFQRSR